MQKFGFLTSLYLSSYLYYRQVQAINAQEKKVYKISGLKSLGTVILLYSFPTVFNNFAAAVLFSTAVFTSFPVRVFAYAMVW